MVTRPNQTKNTCLVRDIIVNKASLRKLLNLVDLQLKNQSQLALNLLERRDLVCLSSSMALSMVRKNGKDGLKTMLTGLIIRLPRLMLDLHIILLCCNLMSLAPLVELLACLNLLATSEAKKNGKDGLKIMLTGKINKWEWPIPESLMLLLLFREN
jgi:hypothetical protein